MAPSGKQNLESWVPPNLVAFLFFKAHRRGKEIMPAFLQQNQENSRERFRVS